MSKHSFRAIKLYKGVHYQYIIGTMLKLDHKVFEFVFTPEVKELLKVFDKHKYEIRLVGGVVRDILLGKQPNDLDFATTATYKEMVQMFDAENIHMMNTNGEKHGTISVRMNEKENFEITTLRKDVGSDADVKFANDWELDANRRDLTINSMFLGFDGTLYDCLLYTSPSPRDRQKSRMPSSA